MVRSPAVMPRGEPIREAHAHLLWHGQSLDRVDLSNCRGAAEAIELIAQRARERAGPIFAGGARPEAWDPPGYPTLAELDRAAGGRVCVIWCFDTHTAAASTAALRRIGIDRGTPDPPDGVIARDSSGDPTGVLSESAVEPLRLLEEGDAETVARQLRLAGEDLERQGFGEVHDLKSPPWLPRVLTEMGYRGPRLVLYPLVQDLPAMAATRGKWESDRLRLGGGKIFTDGTLNSRTAWMLEPWCDAEGGDGAGGGAGGGPTPAAARHPRGVAMWSPAQIREAVGVCESLGLPIAAHAIGDAAARAVLDAIEAAGAGRGGGPARLGGPVGRHRLEHAQFVHPDDVARFAALGVIASVQPCHLLYDIEALRRATPDRLERVLPLRSLIDAGCRPGELMWFGSDTPVVRPDPDDSIQAAVHRRRVDMEASDAINPGEAIGLEEAVACFVMRGGG